MTTPQAPPAALPGPAPAPASGNTHTNTLHQGPEAAQDTQSPASTARQRGRDTQPKHAVSYPLPPLPWQTWGAHPPWHSRISLGGEEKRQRTWLLLGCHCCNTTPARGASCSGMERDVPASGTRTALRWGQQGHGEASGGTEVLGGRRGTREGAEGSDCLSKVCCACLVEQGGKEGGSWVGFPVPQTVAGGWKYLQNGPSLTWYHCIL